MFGCTVFVTYCGSADYLIINHGHDTLYNDPANYLYINSVLSRLLFVTGHAQLGSCNILF